MPEYPITREAALLILAQDALELADGLLATPPATVNDRASANAELRELHVKFRELAET